MARATPRFAPPWTVDDNGACFIGALNVPDTSVVDLRMVILSTLDRVPPCKTRSSVVSGISLDSVPVKAQPKNKRDTSAIVRAFKQEDRHVEGSKRQ